MQLTKKQLTETQMIVTTPEKWDVITRKSSDVALTSLVRLLIIDEVHLLHEGIKTFLQMGKKSNRF
jgi:replicative superfamily II helicase